ncbi:nucleoside triphosphate pyrophosphohydrolase [Alteribacillus iranensis]|uniref:Predicted house-cleaning noncanonical NTP pyrophosphatase, all-alpha NTP-PPase (MazG) superfamily n=1 Tax=Alteribacillus iranensis TaxID=930128 RepID=A0A1I2FMB6_9BACI|nr:nucleoside triphosphate pyrophosphohydrolase [Alteribacillus iranensis]SFF05561.1 Predicted house-cleaning noncanonical NTP pyrophosphatase, all-alpha NTP-PPase (MazG) superfamily [Alteribacillus iranensis]
MTVHNKLVRDKIPEIIERAGKKYTATKLNEEEFARELRKKLEEEVSEYMEAEKDQDALEELADISELLHALAQVHGGRMEDVEDIRKEKAEKRGGFERRIFLQEVQE